MFPDIVISISPCIRPSIRSCILVGFGISVNMSRNSSPRDLSRMLSSVNFVFGVDESWIEWCMTPIALAVHIWWLRSCVVEPLSRRAVLDTIATFSPSLCCGAESTCTPVPPPENIRIKTTACASSFDIDRLINLLTPPYILSRIAVPKL